ncbi:AfsR/SARP family transcriptional regulator [Nocardiopsis ansamitocini]|uniref:OmpR/PhoB-type domain-containing protein n=1 Tax=Nocardiopsis ansamitocini TaxID=1670832 RepID=A0A9W6ULF6_9ACTN|nr:AfsR/SARP family transcriptional regulator [Nocardiopsis ansamitocini]GLU50030.1 hypothetical protein Nans01_43810 [Nocardiopsis ansamitocini]
MTHVTHVHLLGEVAVRVEGREVNLGPAKQRAVFSVLAMHANRVVSRDELIQGVWGAKVPATVESSIYTYVARLRRLLEPQRSARSPSEVLIQDGSGYQFRTSPQLIDVQLFDRHLQQARCHGSGGNLDDAVAELDAALSHWKGLAFAGLSGPFIEVERNRLDALKFTAMEERLWALIELGRHQEAIGELSTLALVHPLREKVRSLLMRAYHESGRRAEALAEFRDIRTRLVTELGIEPGVDLQNAHERILREDTSRRQAVTPSALPVTRNGRIVPAQLPRDISALRGREEELQRLRRLATHPEAADKTPVFAIDGPPGVGKSVFAIRFAHQISTDFADGQLYLDMRGFSENSAPLTATDAKEILLGGLGISVPAGMDTDPQQQAGFYRSALAGRRLLIVLDNVRFVEQVRPLLPGGSSCLVLVTSRNRLSGLAVRDGASLITLDGLCEWDAVAVMEEVIVRGGGTPPSYERLGAIARMCGYVPVALCAAAEKIATSGPDPVEEMIVQDGLLELLDLGSDPLTSIRSALLSSYRTLSPQAARMLLALGRADTPDFDLSAAAKLACTNSPETWRGLNLLNRSSLVQQGTDGRFRMNALVRAYARALNAKDMQGFDSSVC